jgi:hypothetical protein
LDGLIAGCGPGFEVYRDWAKENGVDGGLLLDLGLLGRREDGIAFLSDPLNGKFTRDHATTIIDQLIRLHNHPTPQ